MDWDSVLSIVRRPWGRGLRGVVLVSVGCRSRSLSVCAMLCCVLYYCTAEWLIPPWSVLGVWLMPSSAVVVHTAQQFGFPPSATMAHAAGDWLINARVVTLALVSVQDGDKDLLVNNPFFRWSIIFWENGDSYADSYSFINLGLVMFR